MQTNITPSIVRIEDKKRHWPAVSIIIPFEPVVRRKDELMQNLQKIMKRVEWELGTGYDDDLVDLVMMKLKVIISGLNFTTFKKSLAIYVSPVFEKVIYMDMTVEETVTINESFIIRDIVHAKKEIPAYFVLVLNRKWSIVYEGNGSRLVKIKSNGIGNTPAVGSHRLKTREKDEDTGEFFVKRFLRHSDEGLSILLSVMPRPVLVLGNKEILDSFKSLTVNNKSIVEYVEGSFSKVTEEGLFKEIGSYITDWDKIKIKHLYRQLEKAATEGKLVSGIRDVHRSVLHHRNRLLIVSKNFLHNPEITEVDQPGHAGSRFNKFSCVQHIIDDIIERVVGNGGDVALVDEDVLGGQQIVLLNDKLENS